LAKQTVLTHLARSLFPAAYIAEHMQGRYTEVLGRKVGAVEGEYRNTLGFPVLVYPTTFIEAVNSLVLDGVFNLAHPAGTQHAVENVTLREAELMEATFAAPSARPAAAPVDRPTAFVPTGGFGHPAVTTPGGGGASSTAVDVLPFTSAAQTLTTGFCESRQ